MSVRATLVLAIGLFAGIARADLDQQVDDPDIGRVFMSQAERDELDRLRKLPPPSESAGTAARAKTVVEPESLPEGTGYILRSRGAAWLWVDGDFQSVRPAEVDRPGRSEDIRIIRHQQPAADAKTVDAGSPEPAGADDAEGN